MTQNALLTRLKVSVTLKTTLITLIGWPSTVNPAVTTAVRVKIYIKIPRRMETYLFLKVFSSLLDGCSKRPFLNCRTFPNNESQLNVVNKFCNNLNSVLKVNSIYKCLPLYFKITKLIYFIEIHDYGVRTLND